jgi:hypothetical protein
MWCVKNIFQTKRGGGSGKVCGARAMNGNRRSITNNNSR